MSKQDGRKLSEDTLQFLRIRAHELRKVHHYTWDSIAEALGVSRCSLMNWAQRYGIGGDGELKSVASAKRGRTFGDHRTLDLSAETLVRDRIVENSPAQCGLPYALWNRKAVRDIIKVMFGVDMPARTVGEYLRRWGFTAQRPAKRAMEQNPIKVQRWLEMEYPAIVRRAHIEQAEIYWADETGVRQDAAWARGYAPRGHTPTREHTERRPRYGLTLMSALTNQGLMRFEFFDGGMNADRFIGFMDGLIHDAKLKVFLIVDRLSAHNAHKVEDWLSANNDRIELFFLPPYSPELNPDELVNRDLKTELRTRPATNHTGTLKGIARDFMETLSSLPRRVSRYFLNRHVSYASSEAAMSILLLPA